MTLYIRTWIYIVVLFWLILPVVICLSQRLSHACQRQIEYVSWAANGSLNQS